jgi:hypothetical protein
MLEMPDWNVSRHGRLVVVQELHGWVFQSAAWPCAVPGLRSRHFSDLEWIHHLRQMPEIYLSEQCGSHVLLGVRSWIVQ